MLKTLKNQSKKAILTKHKIKDFIIYQLWFYVVVFASTALCAWLFNRWIEAIMFCIAHTCIRNTFDRQFHFHQKAYCLCLTLAIVWFAIPITLPITVSLLGSIPVAFGICYIGYLVADRIAAVQECKKLEIELNSLVSELQKYKHLDIYNMCETDLRQYAASQGLSEQQIDILCMRIYNHLKISEICKYAHYGRTTIKYHLGQIKYKLNITTL